MADKTLNFNLNADASKVASELKKAAGELRNLTAAQKAAAQATLNQAAAKRALSQADLQEARAARAAAQANLEGARAAKTLAAAKAASVKQGNALTAAFMQLKGAGTALANVLTGIVRGFAQVIGGLFRMIGAAIQAAAALGSELLGAVTRLGSVMAGAAATGAVALAGALGAVGKAGVEMNIALQTARVGLTAITGSSEKADRLIRDLRETAKSTAPTFKELLPIGQGLAAIYGPAGLGKVIPTIRAFDAAAKVLAGGDPGAAGRALTQFRQMIAGGKLQQDELKLMEENLPGAGFNNIIRKRFGTTDSKELAEGGVTGMMGADAIVEALSKKFGGVSGAMAGSLPMLGSGIEDTFNDLSATVTEGFTKRLGTAAQALSDFLNNLQNTSSGQAMLKGLSDLFNAIGDALVRLSQSLPALLDGLQKALAWIGDNAPKAWAVFKNAVIEAGGVIGGVIAGVAAVIQDFAQGGAADLGGLLENIRTFAGGVIRTIGGVIQIMGMLAAAYAAVNAFSPLQREIAAGGELNPIKRLQKQQRFTNEMLGVSGSLAKGAQAAPGMAGQIADMVQGVTPLPGMGDFMKRQDSLGTFSRAFEGFRGNFRKQAGTAFGNLESGAASLFQPTGGADLSALGIPAQGVSVPNPNFVPSGPMMFPGAGGGGAPLLPSVTTQGMVTSPTQANQIVINAPRGSDPAQVAEIVRRELERLNQQAYG